MRIFLATLAILIYTPIVSAGQVVDGTSYNFNGTNWSVNDCNGDGPKYNCPLNGAGGDGPGDADGEGESGKS